jgi:guanylate kinase
VTEQQFQERIDAGGFLEWVQFLDYRQGTPTPHPPPGADVLFEIDVYGAREVKRHFPDALLVFVEAPSLEEQERRLRGRGDDEAKLTKRLAKAAEERLIAKEIGMVTLINDDLDRAVAELHDLVTDFRKAEIG